MDTRLNTLAVTALALLLSGCGPAPQAVLPVEPKPVQTERLNFSDHYQIQHQLVGQIRNQRTSAIGFELAGVIAHAPAQVGDKVRTGDVLAQLDTALLNTEAQQLQANIRQLNAQRQLNQSTLNRQLTLQQQGYQSQQQLDELNSQQQILSAQLQQAQSQLAANQLRLNKSQLKAPFSGTVSQRELAPGQVVNVGQSVLTLVPERGAEARVGVPVALLNKLGNQFEYQLRHGDNQLSAQLLGQSASVDPVTRTVDLRFALPENRSWFDGDLIYLSLTETVQASNAQVPLSALVSGLRGRWNLMVPTQSHDQQQPQWLLQRRDVTILHSDQDIAVISGAINGNEPFVSAGLQALVQGQAVSLIEAKQ
ncbi:efflux RND transporter periplasmic adaptor subunit [uncultured Ferrimonas sp.]|uniref:efflux RND transporter periplasmic adaptor subunit n=1 Tax=uncultured Ferrimonas sp. TaxID=432640 RepID=UPI0026307319|nr:efflux RND transporter periplasmic adaptor subunit [uncultured Ferrimonas sp.]